MGQRGPVRTVFRPEIGDECRQLGFEIRGYIGVILQRLLEIES